MTIPWNGLAVITAGLRMRANAKSFRRIMLPVVKRLPTLYVRCVYDDYGT